MSEKFFSTVPDSMREREEMAAQALFLLPCDCVDLLPGRSQREAMLFANGRILFVGCLSALRRLWWMRTNCDRGDLGEHVRMSGIQNRFPDGAGRSGGVRLPYDDTGSVAIIRIGVTQAYGTSL